MKHNEEDNIGFGFEVEHEDEGEDKPVEDDYNYYTDEVGVKQSQTTHI